MKLYWQKLWTITQICNEKVSTSRRTVEHTVGAYHNTSPGQLSTSGWLAERSKALANQHRQRRHQHPLGWAPLATANTDADHIELVSLSQLLLPWDSSSGVHTETASLLAATQTADPQERLPRPIGKSIASAYRLQLAKSHPAAEQGGLPSLAQTSLLWSELCWQSSGSPRLRVMALSPATAYSACLLICILFF
jgi:hypothetical protein